MLGYTPKIQDSYIKIEDTDRRTVRNIKDQLPGNKTFDRNKNKSLCSHLVLNKNKFILYSDA